MDKVFPKLVAMISILAILPGCMPKYAVKYDVNRSDKKISELNSSKIGVLLLEDDRPKIESEGANGSRISLPDTRFEQPVPVMVTDLLVKHFEETQGQMGNTISLGKNAKDVGLDAIAGIKDQGISDYILMGSIKHYTASLYDQYYAARMIGSFVAGFTIVGLVFMPVILSGNVEVSSEVEFDHMMLVKVDGPQILWIGRAYTTFKGQTPLISATGNVIVKAYETTTKKSIQELYENIQLASDAGFPQKYSVEDSKRILSNIKQDGSLARLKL